METRTFISDQSRIEDVSRVMERLLKAAKSDRTETHVVRFAGVGDMPISSRATRQTLSPTYHLQAVEKTLMDATKIYLASQGSAAGTRQVETLCRAARRTYFGHRP